MMQPPRVLLPGLILVAGMMLGSGACKKKEQEGSRPASSGSGATAGTPRGDEASARTGTSGTQASDTPSKASPGAFVPVYRDSKVPEVAAIMREARVLEELTAELNAVIALPRDLTVAFEDCGEPNAFYDDKAHRITTCYELIALFDDMFARELGSADSDGDEALEATVGATLFTLFHELGHALVHMLELPTTGKEEDAVDQLATLILIEGGEDGQIMALDSAHSFLLQSADSNPTIDELPFWDEHSLDEQRFYNIVCLIYGADPQRYADLIKDGDLPEERAELCPEDYQRASRAWDKILAPHLK